MNTKSLEQSLQLSLVIRQITFEGKGINSYELVDPAGQQLPEFTAGAHMDIYLDNSITRQYSLCNDPSERYRYVIAVLRDEHGRGGSIAIHDRLKVQGTISVSVPRNNFELENGIKRAILIAGGIGITPLKSMAHSLEKMGVPYELHYCAKDSSCVAFAEELKQLDSNEHVFFHYDGGEPGRGLDLAQLLMSQKDGEHLYYCGPGGFMEACRKASSHWRPDSVHFEHFKAPVVVRDMPNGTVLEGRRIQLASTGEFLNVTAGKSIAEVLNNAGVEIPTSCESGLCGTCKVRYTSGEIDHQDFILNDTERTEYFTACVSCVKSDLVVLDL